MCWANYYAKSQAYVRRSVDDVGKFSVKVKTKFPFGPLATVWPSGHYGQEKRTKKAQFHWMHNLKKYSWLQPYQKRYIIGRIINFPGYVFFVLF